MKFLKNNGSGFIGCAIAMTLVACDDISNSSSNGGQELTSFSPNVQSIGEGVLPTNIVDTSDLVDTTSSTDTSTTTTNTNTTTTDTTASDTTTPISTRSLAGTGIVWKPISEGDGRLVVLTPTSFGQPAVSVLDASGNTVENGQYVGHTNGNRATYRFGRSGGGYSAPAFLRVGSSTFLVSQPASRYN